MIKKPSYPRDMSDRAKADDRSLVTVDVPGMTFQGPIDPALAGALLKWVTENIFKQRNKKPERTEPYWQPIETAPRGSGLDGPSNTRHPDYVKPPRLLLFSREGITVGNYDWYYHDGYSQGAIPGVPAWQSEAGESIYGVTHWMPLPPEPPLS